MKSNRAIAGVMVGQEGKLQHVVVAHVRGGKGDPSISAPITAGERTCREACEIAAANGGACQRCV